MDDLLIQALKRSFSPEQAQRDEAEAFLRKNEQVEGYLTALIRIWVNQSIDLEVRQSASIQAKNTIRKHWSRGMTWEGTLVEGVIGTPGSYEMSEVEKTFVKEHMIEVLVHCAEHTNLRAQALESVKLVVNREYPLRWPGFLKQCLTLVSSGDETKTLCGLACVRVIAREFEMKSSGKSREPLEEVIAVAMPGLLTLGEQLVKNASQVAPATLLKFILKIFYSTVQTKLSPSLAEQSVCTRWFELISQAARVVPADLNADIEEGVHAKVHKWAFRIFSRFFSKFGNPDLVEEDGDAKFSQWWLGNFAPPLVAVAIEALQNPRMSKSAKYQAISFLSEGIQHAVTYKSMKTHLPTLLFEIIFPLMCFTAEDGELWESDPEEYVRRETDCMMMYSDPRSAAVEFLKNMVALRSKDSLAPLLKFCESHLEATGADLARCARKDGALTIIGSIAPQLCVSCKKKSKKSTSAAAGRLPDKAQLESMLAQYVLPDFASPVGFLKYRACWVYQQFAEEQFPFANPQTTQAAFAGYLSCLVDKELPVRVQAGCSVKAFVLHEEFTPMIAAAVPDLLDKLLRLMHEVDSEPLAATLESLVENFAEQVLPFAAQAIDQLGKVFVRLCDSEEDEAQLASMGAIQTIVTIMEAASSTPAMFGSLEQVCYPVLDKILQPDGVDFMDEALDILTYLTFFCAEPLGPGMWRYFDLLHQSVCGPTGATEGWAVDYVENMLNVMDNFISRGTQVFLVGRGFCGRSYMQMLHEIVTKSLTHDNESVQIAGAKIAACVFESCPRGTVDDWVQPYLQLGWSKFSTETSGLNRWLFYLFTMALYYDCVVTARTADALGIGADFFAVFAKLSKFAKAKDERKALCLALCGLLRRLSELGPGSAAAVHVKSYVEILAVQTKELAEMRKTAREAAAEGSDDEDDEEDEDDDYEDEIDLQDLDEGQSADQSSKIRLANKLKEEIAQIRQQFGLNEDVLDDDEDDDDYDEDYDDDECERISPLDAFSEFSAIQETLKAMDMNVLLGWFSQADLVGWNQLLDDNVAKDIQDKQVKAA